MSTGMRAARLKEGSRLFSEIVLTQNEKIALTSREDQCMGMWSMGTANKSQSFQWPIETDQGKFLALIHKLPPSLLRPVKFCIVGGGGVLVDMTVLYFLADPSRLGWNIILSKICAAGIAMTNNFAWNELWTFRFSNLQPASRNTPYRIFRRFLLFNAICSIGIGLAVILLHIFHIRVGWNLYFSNLMSIVLVTIWNFGMNNRFNWGLAAGRELGDGKRST